MDGCEQIIEFPQAVKNLSLCHLRCGALCQDNPFRSHTGQGSRLRGRSSCLVSYGGLVKLDKYRMGCAWIVAERSLRMEP